jgi:hypothetical protein
MDDYNDNDNDFEPPSLSASSAVPSAEFSAGGPPPAGAFSSHSHSGAGDNNAASSAAAAAAAKSAVTSPSMNDDLNSRWKSYETEQTQTHAHQAEQQQTRTVSPDEKKDGGSSYNNYNLYETPEKLKRSASTTSPSTSAASNRHNLSGSGSGSLSLSRQLYSSGNHSDLLAEPVEPRRTYSFTKSSSYDTNSLIQKYAGVAGTNLPRSSIPMQPSQMAPPPPPPPPMPSSQSSQSSQSSHNSNNSNNSNSNNNTNEPSATSVREEAMKVLAMADQSHASNNHAAHDVNQPFNVRRTESGGFRASMGLQDIMPGAGGNQPYYGGAKRTNSTSKMRTPSALAGLGLSTSNENRVDWKSGRYSFSDPQFREDDYLDNEEEDDIIDGPAVPDDHRKMMSSSYRDHPSQQRQEVFDKVNGDFEGDFPRGNSGSGGGRGGSGSGRSGGSSSWSSRYSDNPRMSNSNLLDRWDTGNQQQQQSSSAQKRQSARNMFMSTASNVRAAAGNVSKSVSNGISSATATASAATATTTAGTGEGGNRVFGAGFSFRKSNTTTNSSNTRNAAARERDDATNLRTVWKDPKDDTFEDECSIASHGKHGGGGGGHKTWEQVMYEKKRRRRIGISMLCVLLAIIIIGISVSQTSFKWKYRSFHKRNGGKGNMAVTFYATSNTPSSNAGNGGGGSGNQKQLSLDLQNIPNDAEFITHLGNLQDSSITQCPNNRNDEIKSIFKQSSPVPIFLVPGEHDWMNCPNPNYSWAKWLDTFSKFTENTFGESNGMVITRPKTSPELFATVHHGVLFIGLHLVNGSLNSQFGGDQGQKEMEIRNEKMIIFVRGTLDNLRGQFRAVVLMGNARPSQQQQSFFDGISVSLKDSKSPVIYLHADSNKLGYVQHYPFSGGSGNAGDNDDYLKKLLAVQVPNGSIGQSPLRITVGFGRKPFQIG